MTAAVSSRRKLMKNRDVARACGEIGSAVQALATANLRGKSRSMRSAGTGAQTHRADDASPALDPCVMGQTMAWHAIGPCSPWPHATY